MVPLFNNPLIKSENEKRIIANINCIVIGCFFIKFFILERTFLGLQVVLIFFNDDELRVIYPLRKIWIKDT